MVLEAILGAIAKKAGNLALKQIVKECSRLSGVRDDLVWIQTEMGRIQSFLKDAEGVQLRTNLESHFMLEMWDLAYDVEDIIDKYFPKLKSPWSHMIVARDFAKEVEDIKKRAKGITDAVQSFKIDKSNCGEVVTWDPRPPDFPHCNDPNVIGFDKQIEDLVQRVHGEQLHRVVSIIGMAGLGKTTLAKKVYNAVRQSYDCSAWIVVSQHPNGKELLRDIAGQVGLPENEMKHNVEANLYAFLRTRRYVIMIDDIWDIEAWKALEPCLPTDSENKSRIILSSRNEDVGISVGGRDCVFKLQPLNQQNSRVLFDKLIVDDSKNITETQYPQQLENIGKKILERCNGVPLAIVLAAGLLKLRPRTPTAWKAVLDGMGQDKDKCAKIFALSYNDLPLDLRPCFLYFGLFAEDEEIRVFELINLWATEGFIRGSDVRDVEEVGDDYLNQLIARNLIQVGRMSFNGRVKSVQIHDILHDLSIKEAKEINFLNIPIDTMNRNAVLKVRRVAIRGKSFDHYLALNPQSSSLRAMLCFLSDEIKCNRSDAKSLLRDSKFLRVLRVEGNISRFLLTEICNLRQLTYLQLVSSGRLKSCVELPHAISNLTNLLTLDIRGIFAIHLPNVIWRMKQLKHILLPNSCNASSSYREKLDVFRQVEFSSTNLQTLYGLPLRIFNIDWFHKLTALRKLTVNWPTDEFIKVLSGATPLSHKLEDLCLSGLFNCPLSSLNLSRYENLRKLKIRYTHLGVLSLPQHDKLPPNLTKLTLEYTQLEKDPMETLKKLQNLKILKLGCKSYQGKILDCSGNFPQLEVFKIEELDKLELVVIEEGGMPRLKDFKILDCSPETQIPDTIRAIMRTTK